MKESINKRDLNNNQLTGLSNYYNPKNNPQLNNVVPIGLNYLNSGKLDHHKFALMLLDNEHIVSLNNRLHIYINGMYVHNIKEIKKRVIEYLPELTEHKIKEVIGRLEIVSEEVEIAPNYYIGFRNGVLDLRNYQFSTHDPSIVLTNLIDSNYNPSVQCNFVDELLNTIFSNDSEIINLVCEMIGYCFYRSNFIASIFLLHGTGGNGKSTILKMISNLLGEENICSLSLTDLNERFRLGILSGKLANIGDDIPNRKITDSSILKKLSSGDRLTAEFKGKDHFEFINFAKLIYSCNRIPLIDDNSEGLRRRLIIIPFKVNMIKQSSFDPFIEDKLRSDEVKSYLVNLGLRGLNRIRQNKSFSLSQEVVKELNKFRENNNPVFDYINENNINGKTVTSVYEDFKIFCKESGINDVLSKNNLTVELKEFGFESKRKYCTLSKKQVRKYMILNEET